MTSTCSYFVCLSLWAFMTKGPSIKVLALHTQEQLSIQQKVLENLTRRSSRIEDQQNSSPSLTFYTNVHSGADYLNRTTLLRLLASKNQDLMSLLQPNIVKKTIPKHHLKTKPSYHKRAQAVSDTSDIPVHYTDVCASQSMFELLTHAVNDKLEAVQVLPNTWVWATRCIESNRACPHMRPGIQSLCQQKKSWVQAFARIHANDPWRWHWIAVDSGCICGVKEP